MLGHARARFARFARYALLSLSVATACHGPTTPSPVEPEAPADPDSDRVSGARQALPEIEREIKSAVREQGIPTAAIGIVVDGEVLLARSFHGSAPEAADGNDTGLRFPLGSTTKTITAVLVARLVEDGVVDWDDPVGKHLPLLARSSASRYGPEPTIGQLMSHQSGYMRMGPVWAGGQRSLDAVLTAASRAEPVRAAGTGFEYNNVTYTAAVVAASRSAGESWDTSVRSYVLDPAGMADTRLSSPERPVSIPPGHGPATGEVLPPSASWSDRASVGPAGALDASLEDMTRWISLLLAGGEIDGAVVVSRSSLESLWVPRASAWPGMAYGRGWFVQEWRGRRMVHHGGNSDSGYSSALALLPDDGVGVVMLTNVANSPLQHQLPDLVFEHLEAVMGPSPGWTLEAPPAATGWAAAWPASPSPEARPLAEGASLDAGWLWRLRSEKVRNRQLRRTTPLELRGEALLPQLGLAAQAAVLLRGPGQALESNLLAEGPIAELGFDRASVWYRRPGGEREEVTNPTYATTLRATSYLGLHGELRTHFPTTEVMGSVVSADADLIRLWLSSPDHDVRLLVDVDAKTGDIVNAWEPDGDRWYLTRYSDFVEFRGLRLPMRRTTWMENLGQVVTVLEQPGG